MYEYRILFPRLGSQEIRRELAGDARTDGRPPPRHRRLPAGAPAPAGAPLMPHDAIATCPICSGELAVTRLHCRSCGTTLEGDFNVGRFARLSREQFALLESFLRSRGNLKEMERELGISYPTVRARVDALLRALGPRRRRRIRSPTSGRRCRCRTEEPARPVGRRPRAARRAVLERLARREIDAATAAAELRALGG